MTHSTHRRWRVLTLMGVLLGVLCQYAPAQDNPFGAPAVPGSPKSADTKEPAAGQPALPEDPWVRALLQTPTTNLVDQMTTAVTLVRLHQEEIAKKYLQQILAANPAPAELVKLQVRFGAAQFITLGTNKSIQPEGANLARAVMDATSTVGRDPKRLAQLAIQLGDPNETLRVTAARELLRAASAAVPALLDVLKQPASEKQRLAAEQTMLALGSDALDPLVAALQSTDTKLVSAALGALGTLKARRTAGALLPLAVPDDNDPTVRRAARTALQNILGEIPTPAESVQFLQRRLDDYLAGSPPAQINENGQIAGWVWDPAKETLVQAVLDVGEARMEAIARLAAALHKLQPDDEAIRVMYLATALEQEQRRVGYDQPLQKPAAPGARQAWKASPTILINALELAREKRFRGAAIALLKRLETAGNTALLTSHNGSPTPLVASLLDPDRRIRYQCARTIVALDPTAPYPGSSYLSAVLGYLASSSGQPHVLIAHPKIAAGRTLTTYLAELGFTATTATTGREFTRRALADPDAAFFLIDDAMASPVQTELVQSLRRDARTSELPIGMIVRDLENHRTRALVESDPLTIVFAWPLSAADMAFETRRMLLAQGRLAVSSEQRIAQAIFALDTLAKWVETPANYQFYNVAALQERIIRTLNAGLLPQRTIRLLGLLGTPDAQAALVTYASSPVRPIAARQAAAAAFRQAVIQHRLLLTRMQITAQYDRYNASANQDRETQQVLADILDVIEMRAHGKSQTGAAPKPK